MATTHKTLTAEDLWSMPDNGGRNELVRGELRPMSPTGARHGRITSTITQRLHTYVEARKLGIVLTGEPGFVLARQPDIVRAPDVAFVRISRVTAAGEPDGFWEGAPDLAVEVMSPHDTVYEVEEKVEDWISLGCSMVVVVSDRKRTVTVHRPAQSPRILRGTEVLDGEDVVPGFRLPLAEIFA